MFAFHPRAKIENQRLGSAGSFFVTGAYPLPLLKCIRALILLMSSSQLLEQKKKNLLLCKQCYWGNSLQDPDRRARYRTIRTRNPKQDPSLRKHSKASLLRVISRASPQTGTAYRIQIDELNNTRCSYFL